MDIPDGVEITGAAVRGRVGEERFAQGRWDDARGGCAARLERRRSSA